MGWAKYDEDNREIVDERRKEQRILDNYGGPSINSVKRQPHVESKEKPVKKGGFFIKYSTGMVRY